MHSPEPPNHGEPWYIDHEYIISATGEPRWPSISDCNGDAVVWDDTKEAVNSHVGVLERIVACVNLLAGISDEDIAEAAKRPLLVLEAIRHIAWEERAGVGRRRTGCAVVSRCPPAPPQLKERT